MYEIEFAQTLWVRVSCNVAARLPDGVYWGKVTGEEHQVGTFRVIKGKWGDPLLPPEFLMTDAGQRLVLLPEG